MIIIIYFLSNQENIKIGYTKNINTFKNRKSNLNTGSSTDLMLIACVDGDMNYEKELHRLFYKDRISINKEWFFPSVELVDWINNNTLMDLYVDVENEIIKVFKKMKK